VAKCSLLILKVMVYKVTTVFQGVESKDVGIKNIGRWHISLQVSGSSPAAEDRQKITGFQIHIRSPDL
jgi:hypothetical protein